MSLETDFELNVTDAMLTPPSLLSCEEIISRELKEDHSHQRLNITEEERRHLAFRAVVEDFVIPIVCVFGVVGNLLNLVVLTRKRVQHSMDHLEKSAHAGFVALAVSDLSFCLLDFTSRFLQEKYAYFRPRDSVLGLYLTTHKEALLNVFMLSSTWLTVVMAMGRYLAVCRPLHARGMISLTWTRSALALVFAGAVAINGPRFLHYTVTGIPCDDLVNATDRPEGGCRCVFYHKDTSDLYRIQEFVFWYSVVWTTVAIATPLAVLVYCNASLVRALRRSYAVQKESRVAHPKDSGHRITPTLVALIVVFLVLVGPSGVVSFARSYVVDPDASGKLYVAFMTANTVTNLLVLVNFAVNFVLYCVVNVHFRRTAAEVVCFLFRMKPRQKARISSSVYLSRYVARNTVGYASDAETEL